MRESEWITEFSYNNTIGMTYKVKEILHSEKSEYQQIDVIDTYALGKFLLLDGKGMVSDIDEFIYHEVMAHIPYMILPEIKNVLIIGGGDGGIVREFVKHKDISRIDLVEIDERVIEVSKKYFPEVASGLSDSRVRILPQDGIQFVKNLSNEYDVIIVDSTDPENFAEGLFTKEFYGDIYNALTPTGIMMNQTECPFLDQFGLKKIYQNMKDSFPIVQSFTAPMIIYPGVYWTFGLSSKKFKGTDIFEQKIDYMKGLEKNLRWYNLDWHKGCFSISNFHKKVLGLE